MKKKILFRADGNSSIGLGHMYRLFALVEMVKDNYDFIYLTKESSSLSVIPKEYFVKTIPSKITIRKEPYWLAEQYNPKEYIVIADGYQFISSYQKELKDYGFSVIYIDDMAAEHMYADLVINHSPSLKKTDYKAAAYTKYALGTKYAMLRPSFLELAKQTQKSELIDSAFVCFGGADMLNLSLKAVKALLEIKQIKRIAVVLGAAYQSQELYDLEKNFSKRLRIYRNLSENALASLMNSCNFAIAPSSTICYELCCVKMPILSGYFVDNQRLIYEGFKNKKAIFGGGDLTYYEISNFKSAIESIIKIKEYNEALDAQQQLFDENIKERHLKLIQKLCSH